MAAEIRGQCSLTKTPFLSNIYTEMFSNRKNQWFYIIHFEEICLVSKKIRTRGKSLSSQGATKLTDNALK